MSLLVNVRRQVFDCACVKRPDVHPLPLSKRGVAQPEELEVPPAKARKRNEAAGQLPEETEAATGDGQLPEAGSADALPEQPAKAARKEDDRSDEEPEAPDGPEVSSAMQWGDLTSTYGDVKQVSDVAGICDIVVANGPGVVTAFFVKLKDSDSRDAVELVRGDCIAYWAGGSFTKHDAENAVEFKITTSGSHCWVVPFGDENKPDRSRKAGMWVKEAADKWGVSMKTLLYGHNCNAAEKSGAKLAKQRGKSCPRLASYSALRCFASELC